MRTHNVIFLSLFLTVAVSCRMDQSSSGVDPAADPGDPEVSTLRQSPDHPRYLQYRGEHIVLITSAEHYGAVINMDFDYKTYLETLEKEGFNYTRIFGGSYVEPVDNIFGIRNNTLAPAPGKYLPPWKKVGDQYDLEAFNPAYFERLSHFMDEAEKRGIIVEFTLFSSIYAENAWNRMPMNSRNNLRGIGAIDFRRVNTLFNGPLKVIQEQYIRKIVSELNRFDNLFYEIQNEPWADNGNLVGYVNEEDNELFSRSWQKRVEVANGVALDWQAWVASIIRDEESDLPRKHLIAQNISNFKYSLDTLPPEVSIVNFHYALPEAVTGNPDIGGVIGLDETGFMPQKDEHYIRQAWRFMMSGGGIYNNLDYSFTVGHERGEWPIPATNPGWGGPAFRKKLSLLAETFTQIPFHEMSFSSSILEGGGPEMSQYGLFKEGEVYAVYVEHCRENALVPAIPEGGYTVTAMDIHTLGQQTVSITHIDGQPLDFSCGIGELVLLIRSNNYSD
jgi:hypothetical protein